MPGGFTPGHAQTSRDLWLAIHSTAPLCSGRIVHRLTIAEVSTSSLTDAGAALTLLLSGGTRVCGWQSAQRL